ncbi:MAG TPA: aminotransferase class V-fold PLP-dependent enzyme, partial [Terriglobales bacterium]|nr:aminotransferase class V-fold PLP-dependent enzyme [Terriglobales bacterium]
MTSTLHSLRRPEFDRKLDLAWVRSNFPSLARTIDDQPVAFLDGPGGTQVTQSVIDAIGHYLKTSNANTHGSFVTSCETDEVIAGARSAMADFLGSQAEEIVFGPNMSTLTFAISRSIGRELNPGDEILLTHLDHSANVSPWQA